MDVVVHKDVSIDAAAGAVLVDGKREEVLLKIGGILKNSLFLVAPDNDVIKGAGELYAGFARHGKKIADKAGNVNISSFQA
jgi:phage gpG-like protein